MLYLSQAPWSVLDEAELDASVRLAADEARLQLLGRDEPILLLLPHSPVMAPRADAFVMLGMIAARHGLYLAGSLVVTEEGEDAALTRGFVFDPTGEAVLVVGKMTPDLTVGFTDTRALAPDSVSFPVAKLPFVQVGMLVGEDIAIAQYARALAFNGAELILNPAIERTDKLLEQRRTSRWGRATDITGFVACATPTATSIGGTMVKLPTGTAFYNWDKEQVRPQADEPLVRVDMDVEALRRMRATPMMAAIAGLRANVYGAGYKLWSGEGGSSTQPATRKGWIAEADRRLKAEQERCGPKLPSYETRYDVCVIQSVPRLIPLGIDNPRAIIMKNLEEGLALAGSRAGVPTMRLVVFPEFWLTGPGGIGGVQRTVQDMEKMAISHGDEVFDRIGDFARKYNVYVAFQNFEIHKKLPGRVFNSAFLVDDQGKLIHTYRKNQCGDIGGLLPDTTPGSIFDQFVDLFGYESIFPVADTPLGKLANMICFDTMSPEVAFALRRAGAEVILHSSSEPHGAEGRLPWENARRLRAYENGCYLLSAIDGGEYVSHDSDHMTFFRRGHTKIVNFDGSLQGVVDGPGPVVLRGYVDLNLLRRHRADPRSNLAIWNEMAAYEAVYNGKVGFPSNLWAGDPYVNPYLGATKVKAVVDDYFARGIFAAPGAPMGADRETQHDTM